MRIEHKAVIWLSMLLLLISTFAAGPAPLLAAETRAAGPSPQLDPVPTVSLRAASGATIAFATQNGRTVDGILPQTRELPHLVLYRNGTLSDAGDRTLLVEVSGLTVPPTGLDVTLELETMHSDPDLGHDSERGIPMWRALHEIANTIGVTRTSVTTTFAHTFGETVARGARAVATPTDYLRYNVTVSGADKADADTAYRLSEEYAFLIENQWIASLPEVAEDAPGAAPDELLVYYCDVFPFRRSVHEPETWLPRDQVTGYVGMELVPRMVEAFRVQSDEWGYPWHEAWTSYRAGDEERLSVALTDGRTWFHGSAPSGGHSAISLAVTGGSNAPFATLTDGLVSTYHHELFHNLQRDILLHNGGDGDVGGAEGAWQFFSEGTAVLAESVGQPRGQFTQALPARTYMAYANGFVWRGGGRTGGLNIGYRDLDPYEAAIYWRFLYEQCGGDSAQRAPAGMEVIRRVLTVLCSGQVVDIRSSADLITAIPEVMDQALAGSSCPFQTYEGSLVAFARAIRSLQWAQGRCIEPGIPAGCGFYDPHQQYQQPPVSAIAYTGTAQTYQDQIGTSFGIDLIDIELDPAATGEPLILEFRPAAGADAAFNVEIWHLAASAQAGKRQRIPIETLDVEALTRADSPEQPTYVIPASDMTGPSTLSLIITRLDAREAADPVGGYTIVVRPVDRS